MKTIIRQSQTAVLKKFYNLFIELTAKNCNQKCKHCYIDFPQFKKVEDFIKTEEIINALNSDACNDIKLIYLTGAEPMTHPEFNAILRLCLKKSNVCICTNGSFINEKKARFLKKVENESENEIFFEISLDHYDEVKNDEIRYRGAYRHAIFAVKHLIKYDFSPIIHCVNYYDEPVDLLSENIHKIFLNFGYELENLKITPYYDRELKQWEDELILSDGVQLDCQWGRVLTTKGVYTCPFLSQDYRGRCGSSFDSFAQKVPLETNNCFTCLKFGKNIFTLNL